MAKKVNTLIQVTIKGNKELIELRKNIELYSKNLKELKQQNKDTKKITDSTAQAFAKNEANLKKARQEYKRAQDGLKGMNKASKNAGSFTLKMAKAFGIAQLAVDGFRKVTQLMQQQIVKGVETFKDFEFEMAKVKAISGASTEEFDKLKKSAEDLGRSTFFTATQVAGLQLNFSKLGFTAAEVLQVQESALLTATATGEDLARTATVIGSTIRGFGLDATEGARVADVMASSFTQSALTLEKFQTSMTKVSSVAALLGMDLEETTAIMGVLTDSGIEASIAGTSLRNIFLKLGDPSSDLAKSIGFTVNSSEDMVREFRRMRDEGVNVEKMLKIVDVRQVNAIANMIKHIDKIEEQTAAYRDSSGAASDMAAIIGDTLEGASLRFRSALDGIYIALVGESGLGNALKESLDRLALFFNKLATDNKFVDGFTNSVLALVNIIKVAAISITTMTIALKGKTFAVNAYTTAQTFANRQLRIFNVLLKRNPIGLIVGLLTAAAASLLVFRDRTEDAADAQRELNDELERERELLSAKVYQDFLKENKLVRQEMKDGTLRDVFASDAEVLETFKSKLKTFSETDLVNFVRFFKDQIMELHTAGEEEPQLKQFFDAQIEDFKIKLNLSFKRLEELQKIREGLDDTKNIINAEKLKNESLLRISKLFLDEFKEVREDDELGQVIKSEALKETLLNIEREYFDNRLANLEVGTDEYLAVKAQQAQFELNLEKDLVAEKIKAYNSEKEAKEALEIAKVQAVAKGASIIGSLAEEGSALSKAAFIVEQGAAVAGVIISGQKEIAAYKLAMANQEAKLIGTGVAMYTPLIAKAKIGTALSVASILAQTIGGFGGGSGKSGEGSQNTSTDVKFEQGGLTRGGMFQGNSHANGGVKFRVGGRIHEAEGGEAIINKKSTSMFRPMLSAINSYNGNGVKFADGGLLNSGEKFAMGGELRSAQQLVSGGMGSSKVVIVESDMTEVQNRISAIESQATF